MTNWMDGYTATWDVYTVDPDTWDDSGSVNGIYEVSVSKDCTDDVPLLETGSMTADIDEFEWSWCRLYMKAEQSGIERHPMATLLFERTSSRFEHGLKTMKMTGRSVL